MIPSELQSRSKTLFFEVENVKKATAKLIEQNETITLEKNKLEFEIQRVTSQLEEADKKNGEISRQIYETQNVIDQLEKDISLVQAVMFFAIFFRIKVT